MKNKMSKIVTVFVIGIILLSISIYLSKSIDYLNSDFFSFWLAGNLIQNGENPYSSIRWIEKHELYGADWISNDTFLYPLPLAVLLVPLGILPFKYASIVWVFATLCIVIGSIFALFSILDLKFNLFLPIVIGATLFRPVITTIRHGQVDAWILLILVLVLLLWKKNRWIMGSFMLPLILLKPQLGIPLLAFLGVYLWAQKKHRSLFFLLIGSLGFALIGWIIEPNWILDFIMINSKKTPGLITYQPSLWGLIGTLCHEKIICTLLTGGTIGSLLTIPVVYLLLKQEIKGPLWVMSLVIPISLMMTPYLWTYDHILIIITIMAIIKILAENNTPFLLAASFFLIIDTLSVLLVFVARFISRDVWSVSVPILLVILLSLMNSEIRSALKRLIETISNNILSYLNPNEI